MRHPTPLFTALAALLSTGCLQLDTFGGEGPDRGAPSGPGEADAELPFVEYCVDRPSAEGSLMGPQGQIFHGPFLDTRDTYLVDLCPPGFLCASPEAEPGDTACVTTVANEDSPYAQYPCAADREHERTLFDMDCRCNSNFEASSTLRMCVSPQRLKDEPEDQQRLFDGTYGRGPHIFSNAHAEAHGSYFDATTREVVIAVEHRAGGPQDDDPFTADSFHNAEGFVMGIHVDTGDRRIISGAYYDEETQSMAKVGDGYRFSLAKKAHLGPDGELYVLGYVGNGRVQILRVDPQSGDRALVWSNQPAIYTQHPEMGVCDHGRRGGSFDAHPRAVTVDNADPSFVVDAAGDFYLNFNKAGHGTGSGLIKVSNDGRTCAYFSRTSTDPENDYFGQEIGEGPSFGQGSLASLRIVGEHIYAANFINGTFFRVSLSTGDRELLGGDVEGYAQIEPDPHDPDLFILSGSEAAATKLQRFSLQARSAFNIYTEEAWRRGPLYAPRLGKGGVFFDADHPQWLYFVHQDMALIKGEYGTYNNYILSL